MSKINDMSEAELKRLEKKIAKEYKKASIEAAKEAQEHMSKYAPIWQLEHDKMLADIEGMNKAEAMAREAQFHAWEQNYIARGNRWKQISKDLADRAVNANAVVDKLINDGAANVFGMNYNFTAYEIETGSGIAFNIMSEEAVKEMLNGNNHVVFKARHNRIADYEWNTALAQKSITSSIMQGKSLKKAAKSLVDDVMKRNEGAARRNARTAIGSAMNAGRQKALDVLGDMGVKSEKMWVATLDGRTRDSHKYMDGERVPYNEEFSNGLMYPKDPNGAPAEVYNCRCTMDTLLPDEEFHIKRAVKDEEGHTMRDEHGDVIYFQGTYQGRNGTLSYEKWLEKKKNGS